MKACFVSTVAVLTLGFFSTPKVSAYTLFLDTFDAPDNTNFDASVVGPDRIQGPLAGETYLRSWAVQQDISNNQLLLPNRASSGVRWELATNDPTGGQNDRYDWAAGSQGAAILASNNFSVNFDWTPDNNTSSDWVSFQVGTVNADNGNLTNDDHGILFRNNGGTQRFANVPVDFADGAAGSSFTSTAGVSHAVDINYRFEDLADGTNVIATSRVDGVQVARDTFQWDGNAGQLRFELGNLAANTRIDNLRISIPEPSRALLLGLGLTTLLLRRRR